jgi:ubiquinone/menaquinone biosynthesis C-methylase UbiE
VVLDAGCGWGDSSFWINANIGAHTFGINIDGEQVARCWEKAVARGLADLANFARGDYHRTAFDDESFDVVWAAESVCHSPNKQQVLSEMFRVLRPGGRLVLADFVRAERPMSPEREAKLHAWISSPPPPASPTCVAEETSHIRPSAAYLYRLGRRLAPFAQAFRLLRLPFYREYTHHNWKSSLTQFEALEAGAWQYAILTGVKR